MRDLFPKNKNINKSSEAKLISQDFNENIKYIKNQLSNCSDLDFRPIKIAKDSRINAYIFFIDSMVNREFMAEHIIKPLIQLPFDKDDKSSIHSKIYNELLLVGSIKIEKDLDSLIIRSLTGYICIVVENETLGFAILAKELENRPIEEPSSETVIKGMRSGFVENIRINTSLIRRIIKSPKLKIERLTIGRLSNTEVNIVYIEGLAMKGLVDEVKQRILRIDIDSVFTIGSLQELMDDSVFSIFSQSYSTERPDKACSCLLEGRVIITIDNSPFVMVAPATIVHYTQSADDYNAKYISASFSRLLRLFSLLINVFLPGAYVAIFSYHHEMIPTTLLVAISQTREQLPFPIFLEMILLQFAFEILKEAGVRLPRPVGQTVSIVGALVIGQAAVSAKLVSPPSIIVVALTAICSFTVPITEGGNSLKILLFLNLISGGLLGIPGIIFTSLIVIIHLCGLRSFGIPYLSPISPFSLSDWKDFIIRMPTSYLNKRPKQTVKGNRVRQSWKKE